MPFLGANRTALLAGWSGGDPTFTARPNFTVVTGGQSPGYPYLGTSSAFSDTLINNTGWSYSGTSAPSGWGSFLAVNVYLPDISDTIRISQLRTISSTNNFPWELDVTSTSSTTFDINLGYGGPTMSIRAGLTKSTYTNRWLTVVASLYNTSANYATWTGGTNTDTYPFYGRVVVVDNATNTILTQGDNSAGSSASGYANILNGTNNWVPTQSGSDYGLEWQFGEQGNTGVAGIGMANPWFAFGGTLDPAAQYGQFVGFVTPSVGISPVLYHSMKSAGDYTASGGQYYIAEGTGSRITGGTTVSDPTKTQNTTNAPALTNI